MEKNLAKTYDPKDFEDRIYEMWESNGAFHAEVDPDKKPFISQVSFTWGTRWIRLCRMF